MCDDEVFWMRGEMNDELQLLRDLLKNELIGTMSIRVRSGEYTFAAYWR